MRLHDYISSKNNHLSNPRTQARQRILLCVHVNSDGIGDVQHLIGIYKYFKENKLSDFYDFIPIVYAKKSHLNKVKEKLESSIKPFENFYGDEELFLIEHAHLSKLFSTADQIIFISFRILHPFDPFLKYINSDAIVKFIGEHEQSTSPYKVSLKNYSENKIISTSMGLRQDNHSFPYGIKLEKKSNESASDLLKKIQENDKEFCETLMTTMKINSIDEAPGNIHLLPAYFSQLQLFVGFLMLLAVNKKLNKPIAICFSTGQHDNLLTELASLISKCKKNIKLLQHIHVNTIYLIDKNNNSINVTLNKDADKNIYIFVNFSLSNVSYKALYQTALFAGVSGDNSLELAIPLTLPFYHSTNMSDKQGTLYAIKSIVDRLSLPIRLTESFHLFFDRNKFLEFNEAKDESLIESYAKLDLITMSEQWPQIAQFIIKNYNFYDKLNYLLVNGSFSNNHLSDIQKILEQLREQNLYVFFTPSLVQIYLKLTELFSIELENINIEPGSQFIDVIPKINDFSSLKLANSILLLIKNYLKNDTNLNEIIKIFESELEKFRLKSLIQKNNPDEIIFFKSKYTKKHDLMTDIMNLSKEMILITHQHPDAKFNKLH